MKSKSIPVVGPTLRQRRFHFVANCSTSIAIVIQWSKCWVGPVSSQPRELIGSNFISLSAAILLLMQSVASKGGWPRCQRQNHTNILGGRVGLGGEGGGAAYILSMWCTAMHGGKWVSETQNQVVLNMKCMYYFNIIDTTCTKASNCKLIKGRVHTDRKYFFFE